MLSVPCEKVFRLPKGSQPTGWERLDMTFSLTSRKSRRLRSLWGVKGNAPAAQRAPGKHFTQGNNREGHFFMNILNEKPKSEIPGTGTQTSLLSTFRCIQRELQPGPWFSLAFLMLQLQFPSAEENSKTLHTQRYTWNNRLLMLVAHGGTSSLQGTPAHIVLASLFCFNLNLLFIFSCYFWHFALIISCSLPCLWLLCPNIWSF